MSTRGVRYLATIRAIGDPAPTGAAVAREVRSACAGLGRPTVAVGGATAQPDGTWQLPLTATQRGLATASAIVLPWMKQIAFALAWWEVRGSGALLLLADIVEVEDEADE